MEVTMKSTKQEIMDAYLDAKKKLDSLSEMSYDPASDEKVRAAEEKLRAAEEICKKGILSAEITEKYNALKESITEMETRLKTLHGIEVEANSMVALINAHKIKEQELKDKYNAMDTELMNNYRKTESNLMDAINELESKKELALKQIKDESKELKAQVDKERRNENEEYHYELRRSRKIEMDKWNDEKEAREKELSAREEAVAEREEKVTKSEKYIAELEAKVEAIPDQLAAATEEGIKKGTADANKSNAFEVRAINTKNEYEQKSLRESIERLKNELDVANSKNADLQSKLDIAYGQMRELASETVKSAGGVKILNHENTSK